jgi:4'-phosphopantetheinyl transferase
MAAVDLWSLPPKMLKLESDEVHVWRASLDLEASSVQHLQPTLCTEEQQRAERFHFQKDRDRFIIARGLLRTLLSRYLGKEPRHLQFVYSQYGKPALSEAYGKDTLCFNVSHSRSLILYAVTLNRNIGVDLEYIRTDFSCEEIAEKFFSPQENSMLSTLPVEMKHKAFFNCWTRKEAYIKATGKGLSFP